MIDLLIYPESSYYSIRKGVYDIWHAKRGNFYGAEGGTIPQIFCSRWMQKF